MTTTSMRAALYRRFGDAADVIELVDLPRPSPGDGEVRIRLAASGVNPSDVKTRAGQSRPMSAAFQIPGSDGAGIIDAVGTGVPQSRIGERVWVFNAAYLRAQGTSAQYTVVPSGNAPALPPSLDAVEGACLGIPVMTAHRCVFADGPVRGLSVLVTGGAGVVGHYAIQLARWGGARVVIATASSPAKADHARDAGAHHVVDYRTHDVVTAVRDVVGAHGVDRVIDVDLGANLATVAKVVADHGTIAAYASTADPTPRLPFYALAIRNVVVRPVLVYSMSDPAKRHAVDDIEAWAAGGSARFAIARRFPLEAIVDAHRFVEAADKIGHVVLTIA